MSFISSCSVIDWCYYPQITYLYFRNSTAKNKTTIIDTTLDKNYQYRYMVKKNFTLIIGMQCFESGSALDPRSMGSWTRICTANADPHWVRVPWAPGSRFALRMRIRIQ
jgi:hypothetical protein